MNIPFLQAKSISYSGTRAYSSIYYIIIHYTGINNDTAANEAKYFATGNTRSAGAHFFVDQRGNMYQSIKMSYAANSVPRKRQAYKGGGTLVGKCTSFNSISIEMCDNLTKDPSAAQTEAVRELVAYIQSVCPNARTIVRHYDVTGKLCPARMTDTNATDSAKWKKFVADISIWKDETTQKEDEPLTNEDIKKVQKMIDDSISKALVGKNLPASEWAVAEGIVTAAVSEGITDGSRPQGYTKREEVWAMITRALNKLKAGGESD